MSEQNPSGWPVTMYSESTEQLNPVYNEAIEDVVLRLPAPEELPDTPDITELQQ